MVVAVALALIFAFLLLFTDWFTTFLKTLACLAFLALPVALLLYWIGCGISAGIP